MSREVSVRETLESIRIKHSLVSDVDCFNSLVYYILFGWNMGGFMMRLLSDEPKDELLSVMHENLRPHIKDYYKMMDEAKLVFGEKLDRYKSQWTEDVTNHQNT